MWLIISRLILKFRLYLILLIFGITLFMVYQAQNVRMSYDFIAAVPSDDEDLIFFNKFKETFGDDGKIFAIGLAGDQLYQVDNFRKLKNFTQKISEIPGIEQVLSLPQLYYLEKNTTDKRFIPKRIFDPIPDQQNQLDSLLDFAYNQKFYENLLFNSETKATLVLATINDATLNSNQRQRVIDAIQLLGGDFEKETGLQLRYAGLPFIRSIITGQVAQELKILLALSGVVTAIILFLFFGTLTSVIFPMIIIVTVVLWCVGFLGLFGYKITILTALLPPVLVVIGIPNCVYLLNKYHQEFRKHQNKTKALEEIIQKIGVVTLMTNMTTAIGFAVFIFMGHVNIKEFGVISSLCIVSMFLVSIILLPSLYSYLPPPSESEMRHLDRKPLSRLLNFFHISVFRYRPVVFVIVLLIAVVAVFGVLRLKSLSFMVDNIPEDSKPKKDLAFFEQNFGGLMPLEIMVDTEKKKGVMRASTLKKVEAFEESLREIDLFSEPLSLVNLVKASRQAYYNNSEKFFGLPTNQDRGFILRYLQGGEDSTTRSFLNALVDSTGQSMRISLKVADVGSIRLDSVIHQVLQPKIKEAFPDEKIKVRATGTTLLFLKGNDYLVQSLQNSLLLAIALIAFLMALLFGSVRMILISIITNLLPLAITAGLMGYFEVPLKPSTALVFSIAFGIAIDDSIHFLARYRQALANNNYSVAAAIQISLRETGTSMVYTSIILFFGFIIFVYSSFDGTIALGALTATTLLCAMFGNLILLPALLLTFDSARMAKKRRKSSQEEVEANIQE